MNRDDYAPLLERALRNIRAVKARLAETRRPPSARCPVALVGYACRLPGADDPEAYWALLRDGVDAVGPVPADRWASRDWFDPDGGDPDKAYVDAGGYVRDLAGFDPEFFGISPREAVTMDPQQRLLLEVAWEALEHAGIVPGRLKGSRTGVYIGASNFDYGRLYTNATGHLHPFVGTSGIPSVLAGRIAYTLGLEGPAMTVDTACSASLTALALAVRALQSGECDLALVGGVNAIVNPETIQAMCFAGMLARGGRCRPFDAGAEGFARGEGCGLVVLRRLADAEEAGDTVRAVIRGVAINQDGRSAGLTAPNTHAQVNVIRAALADGELAPLDVSYVESHGTGTRLGDPIEMNALREALCGDRPADAPLVVGAVKSNIGHLEPASGVAGLIKAALVVEHGVVPPNLHFEAPNPHIDWEGLPVHLPTAPVPWRGGLIGVSAFGLSGTNTHVVIGSPPAPVASDPPKARGGWILPLSARTADALAVVAARYVDRVAATPDDWPHIAATAARCREPMVERATAIAPDGAAAIERLQALAEGRTAPGIGRDRAAVGRAPEVAFLFTGQGAQYAGMGRALYAEEPVFAAVVDRCAAILAELRPEPLLDVLFDAEGPIDETAWTQPALFVVQVALVELWASLGVRPAAVLGHSVGAYAAAVAAGVMSLEDGLRLVVERGRLMGAQPAGGAMATVEAGERRVLAAARGARWAIAAVNAPDQTVISGDADAIDAAIAAFDAQGLRARRLPVSHAFHSAHMDPAVAAFRAVATRCVMSRPTIRFIDDRLGAVRRGAPTADDWARHLREPVRFADALQALAGGGCDALVEIGPRPALLGYARRVLGKDCPPTLPSLRPDRSAFRESLAALWRLGVPVDWAAHCADPGLRRVALPTYPFQRRRLWHDDLGRSAPTQQGAGDRFAVRWRPHPRPAGRSLTGRWLVAGDGQGLGAALVDGLRAAGVDAEGPIAADPTSLRDHLQAAGDGWAGVIDLGALDGPAFDPDADPLAAVRGARAAGWDGVLAVVDALRQQVQTRLILITRQAVAVAGELPDPLQALRLGMARALWHERGGDRSIDIDGGPIAGTAAALIAALPDDAPELALRGGALYAPRVAPLRPDPVVPPALAGSGSLLITGGLGGVGLAVAERLVERGARHLALMARRPPSDEAADRIADLEARGATVRVVTGDVTRAADVERIVAALAADGAPVTGLVHAAGVLDIALLAEQTPERFERAVAPKLIGAWHLDRALPALDLCLYFSSFVGVAGSPGQANYAAANAALDAFAARRSARGRPTRCIRWGLWQDVGMGRGAHGADARRGGMPALPVSRALAGLEQALADREPLPVIMAPPERAPRHPLFAELAPAPSTEAKPTTARGHVRDALPGLSPEEREARLLTALTAHLAAVLELEPDRIDVGRSGVDLGLDSLLVMEVLDRLEHDLALTVYPREFYNQPSLRAMAAYLLDELRKAEAADAAEAQAGPRHEEAVEGPLAAFVAEMDRQAGPAEPIDGVGFVLSAPRSGSTLLRSMLQGHPRLFAPPELWLLMADDMRQRARHLAPLGLDEGFTVAVREARGCSTEEAQAIVEAMVAEGLPAWQAYARLRGWLGERTLIDKTPLYTHHPEVLERVVDWFAPGPLIHLTRHPLAVMDSLVRTRLSRLVHTEEGDPWFTAEGIWTVSAESMQGLTAAHPDRPVVRVRYEALVTRPQETLEGLCDAIGLPFDAALLDPYGAGRMLGGLHARSAPMGDPNFAERGVIDPRLADAWRAVEPPNPLNPRTRAMADALGYELPARRDRVAVPALAEPTPAVTPPTVERDGPRALGFTVGRLRLAGLEWGPPDGPIVLALHGLLDHAGVWAPVAEALAADGLRVVAPDLRGHGASDHLGPESTYGLLDHVHDVAALLRGLAPAGDPARPALVLGHSMGAAVAAVHAAAADGDWPLLLVEPPLPAASGPEALGRWLDARAASPSHPTLVDLDAAVSRLERTMGDVPPARLRAFAGRAVQSAGGGLRWRWDPRLQLRAELAGGPLDPESWTALLARLAPTLVFAEGSRFVRPADRQAQVAAAGSAPVELPGGHHLPLSAPTALAAICRRLLADPAHDSGRPVD